MTPHPLGPHRGKIPSIGSPLPTRNWVTIPPARGVSSRTNPTLRHGRPAPPRPLCASVHGERDHNEDGVRGERPPGTHLTYTLKVRPEYYVSETTGEQPMQTLSSSCMHTFPFNTCKCASAQSVAHMNSAHIAHIDRILFASSMLADTFLHQMTGKAHSPHNTGKKAAPSTLQPDPDRTRLCAIFLQSHCPLHSRNRLNPASNLTPDPLELPSCKRTLFGHTRSR